MDFWTSGIWTSSRPAEKNLLDLDFWTSGAREFGLLDFWTFGPRLGRLRKNIGLGLLDLALDLWTWTCRPGHGPVDLGALASGLTGQGMKHTGGAIFDESGDCRTKLQKDKTGQKGTKLQNVHLLGFHADSSWAHINCQPHTWMDNRFTLPLWGCVRLRTNPCFPGSPSGRGLVFFAETNAPTVPECNNSCVHHNEGLSRGSNGAAAGPL